MENSNNSDLKDNIKYMAKPLILKRNNNIIISIPMKLKNKHGRKQVIIPDKIDSNIPIKSPVQNHLLLAIAKAFAWKNAIESRVFKSVFELAEKLNVTTHHVNREIGLTYLAPDIIEMIFNGNEPDGVSHTKLLKKMPLLWEEQKKMLNIK